MGIELDELYRFQCYTGWRFTILKSYRNFPGGTVPKMSDILEPCSLPEEKKRLWDTRKLSFETKMDILIGDPATRTKVRVKFGLLTWVPDVAKTATGSHFGNRQQLLQNYCESPAGSILKPIIELDGLYRFD